VGCASCETGTFPPNGYVQPTAQQGPPRCFVGLNVWAGLSTVKHSNGLIDKVYQAVIGPLQGSRVDPQQMIKSH
jgi:hypothetical protein